MLTAGELLHRSLHTKSNQTEVLLVAASNSVCSGSLDRVLLILCPPSADLVTYSLLPGATAGRGMTLDTSDKPIVLTPESHGDLCFRPWFAAPSVIGSTVAIIEGLYFPEHRDGY